MDNTSITLDLKMYSDLSKLLGSKDDLKEVDSLLSEVCKSTFSYFDTNGLISGFVYQNIMQITREISENEFIIDKEHVERVTKIITGLLCRKMKLSNDLFFDLELLISELKESKRVVNMQCAQQVPIKMPIVMQKENSFSANLNNSTTKVAGYPAVYEHSFCSSPPDFKDKLVPNKISSEKDNIKTIGTSNTLADLTKNPTLLKNDFKKIVNENDRNLRADCDDEDDPYYIFPKSEVIDQRYDQNKNLRLSRSDCSNRVNTPDYDNIPFKVTDDIRVRRLFFQKIHLQILASKFHHLSSRVR